MKLTRDRWMAILMLLPSVVLIGVFVYGFIGQTAWTSFSDWGRVPSQALAVNPEIRGRVMSINMMAMGLMPVGVIPISVAAEYIGIHEALLLSAVLLAASVVLVGKRFPEIRRIDRGHEQPGAVA